MSIPVFGGKTLHAEEFLSGGGEMGELIRSIDWSRTPVGPVSSWPQSLRTSVSIMLETHFPMYIAWGPSYTQFYNDGYRPILGSTKHPEAMGISTRKTFAEVWDIIGPMFDGVMQGKAVGFTDFLLPLDRHGFVEECYFIFSYSPIREESGKVGGVLVTVTETTERLLGERRLRTLRKLAEADAEAADMAAASRLCMKAIEENRHDVPFYLLYLFEPRTHVLRLEEGFGFENHPELAPVEIGNDEAYDPWQLLAACKSRKAGVQEVPYGVSGGPWTELSSKAYLLPILKPESDQPYGVLVLGISPRRLFNAAYQEFFELIVGQIATCFNNVATHEAERKRAEALAEINRAKTIFFSNISHEFRTPLTLILGPAEEGLHHQKTLPENRKRMELIYRNALRMQKLVNTLLDFSRIEAGRLEGKFRKVDIAVLTEEFASTFRSAVEKAGLKLYFSAGSIHGDVYVDIDMWEKIVLNLISNAFKYTHEGAITIDVRQAGNEVEVSVSDTGIGIPTTHLERIFDRFHRIEANEGRSQEGTGIGLALVKELVRMHQGSIEVSSVEGKGSRFTVRLPLGRAHLPEGRVVTATIDAPVRIQNNAYVREALRWLPGAGVALDLETTPARAAMKRYRVLVADDNADMLEYVQRLLGDHFEVLTATDGADALDKVLQEQPDLLLTDVMMPRMDGFELLRRVRAHPDSRNLPVIFLSARAGEEAKIEGLEAGADDYLVKPFSAKELLARVEANIKISQNRIAAEDNLRRMIQQSPVAMCIIRGSQLVLELVNGRACELWGKKYEDVVNRPLLAAFPELESQGFREILTDVFETGRPFIANEMPLLLIRKGRPETIFVNFIYEPLRDVDGQTEAIIGVAIDVTTQVQARALIEQSRKELNELANAMPQLVWVADDNGEVAYYNDRLASYAGAEKTAEGKWAWKGLLHPEDRQITATAWKLAVESGQVYQCEHRLQMKDGTFRWHLSRGVPQRNAEGKVFRWFGTATDIHVAKEHSRLMEEEVKRRTEQLIELNKSLQESNQELQQFAHVASHDLKEPLRKIRTFAGRLSDDPDSVFSQKALDYIRRIHTATQRMNVMVEGVLSYSMLNAAEQNIAPVSLQDVMEDILRDLELVIAQKNATISFRGLPVVEGAAVLLYQLFYNLIGNSLKFSKPGTDPMIGIAGDLVHAMDGDYACIRIQDNGIGFDKEESEKIFTTFTRLHSKDLYEGTGLGLSLCKRIVERHDGNITAEGSREDGALFTVLLPLKQAKDHL